jgi:hypothetical protein
VADHRSACYGDHTAEARCITCPHLGDCWVQTATKLRKAEKAGEKEGRSD